MATERIPDLAVLVSRLRVAGMKVDVRQYLAAHQMLLAFAAEGKNLLIDRDDLALYLGPILCTSVEDQQLFANEFAAWARTRPKVNIGPPEKPSARRRSWLATLIASLLGIAVAFGPLAYYVLHQPASPPPPSAAAPLPTTSPPPDKVDSDQRIRVSAPQVIATGSFDTATEQVIAAPWLFSSAGGLGCAGLAFLFAWLLQRRRRALVLKRMPVVDDPEVITLDPVPAVSTDLPQALLLRIVTGWRRPRAVSSVALSLQATIEATARAGGFVTPTFAPRVATPEYLVLIERRGDDDHAWRLIHRWIDQFRERDVIVDRFDFETDPRVCTDPSTLRRHRLSRLLTRYHRAVVVICAETDTLFEEITGRAKPWLDLMQSMPACVFLTLNPPYRWENREVVLGEMGITVLPASPTGLRIISELDNEWHGATAIPTRYTRAFPSVIGSDSVRWLDRNAPHDDTIVLLLRQLTGFLGPTGFLWLCACAVYPQISWSITLAVLEDLVAAGDSLGRTRALTEHLPALSRLPWFRHCYMPDWLRLLLIARLPHDTEASLRTRLGNLVVELFHQEAAESATGLEMSVARTLDSLDVVRAAPPGSPLNDRIFIGFLAGAAPDPLTLNLPAAAIELGRGKRGLVPRVVRRLRAFFTLRPMVAAGVASVLVGGLAGAALFKVIPSRTVPVAVLAAAQTHLFFQGDQQTKVAVAPDSSFLVLRDPRSGGSAVIWDLAAGRARANLQSSANIIRFVVSPNSKLIAGIDSSTILHFWNSDGSIFAKEPATPPLVASPRANDLRPPMSFSGDGRFLAVGVNNQIWILDLAAALAVAPRTEAKPVMDLDFGSDPTRLTVLFPDVLGEIDATANAASPTRLRPMAAQLDGRRLSGLRGLSLSSDGRYVAYAAAAVANPGAVAPVSIVVTYPKGNTTYTLSERLRPPEFVLSPRGEVIAISSPAPEGRPAFFSLGNGRVSETKVPSLPLTGSQQPLFLLQFTSTGGQPDKTYYKLWVSGIEITPPPAASPSASPPPPSVAPPTQPPAANPPPGGPTVQFAYRLPRSLTDPEVPALFRGLAQQLLPIYKNNNTSGSYLPNLAAVEAVAGDFTSAYAARQSLRDRRQAVSPALPVDRNLVYDLYLEARANALSLVSLQTAFQQAYSVMVAKLSSADRSALDRLLQNPPPGYDKDVFAALQRWQGKGNIPVNDGVALVYSYFVFDVYQNIQPFAASLPSRVPQRQTPNQQSQTQQAPVQPPPVEQPASQQPAQQQPPSQQSTQQPTSQPGQPATPVQAAVPPDNASNTAARASEPVRVGPRGTTLEKETFTLPADAKLSAPNQYTADLQMTNGLTVGYVRLTLNRGGPSAGVVDVSVTVTALTDFNLAGRGTPPQSSYATQTVTLGALDFDQPGRGGDVGPLHFNASLVARSSLPNSQQVSDLGAVSVLVQFSGRSPVVPSPPTNVTVQ